MFDKKAMLIDSTADVTATGITGSKVDFYGPDPTEFVYRIVVPAAVDTTSMVAKIQESDDGTTWNDLVTFPTITKAGDNHVHARSKKRYRRAVLTVTGATANFGKVRLGQVSAGNYHSW